VRPRSLRPKRPGSLFRCSDAHALAETNPRPLAAQARARHTPRHAQIEAFEDTWHWNASAEAAFDEVMRSGMGDAFELLRAMRGFLGDNDMMAYLAMMAVRLIELHRVLKPTGSLYLTAIRPRATT
jgi:hypothetical protein